MRPSTDLHLLRDSLEQLYETPYFNQALTQYVRRLIDATEHVLTCDPAYDRDIVQAFSDRVWRAQKYLSGSVSREAPYEMQYCLDKALREWFDADFIITNALLEDKLYHLESVNVGDFVKTALTGFNSSGFDAKLVLIGMPRLYRFKPIYCIPLYHELGHFVDISLGITKLSLLLLPPGPIPSHLAHFHISDATWKKITESHRREHFADLFAACYCGEASINALNTIAGSDGWSPTHPATADRVGLVQRFLGGTRDPLVESFQICLRLQKKPSLSVRFDVPDISSCFDDVRPYKIESERKLHGLFAAAWDYLAAALDNRSAPWIAPGTNDAKIEKVVNDLTEKSIRNMSVREKWDRVATP